MWQRQRSRNCFAFSAYVVVAATASALGLLFPDSYTPEAFMVKQAIYDSLLFGMSIELSIRVFSLFKGIADGVRGLLATAVLASSTAILFFTPGDSRYNDIARYQPGITTAGIWCLTFVALLIVCYQIPVPAFTKAIVMGAVPYWVVFVVYIDLIGRLG